MIMKKIYLQPKALVEGMELEEMIASSLTQSGDSITQDLKEAATAEETSGNLSRQLLFFSVFE